MTFSSGEKKEEEGWQLYVERRAFLTMLHVQDPGSVREHHGPRKRLQERPHRQVAVQICSVVTSMDGERRLSSFPGYITAPCHPGPRPTPLTQKYRYVMSTADFNGFPLNLMYGYILLLTTYIPTLLTY